MDSLIYIFAGVVLLAGVLASICIRSPSRLWVKASAIAITGALVGASYLGFLDLLSKPKPVQLEWVMSDVSEARVIGSSTREGEAIFVWLEIRGVSEPRAYRLPWNRDLAEQLQAANLENRRLATGVRMRRPFGTQGRRVTEDDPVFYAPAAQPAAQKSTAGSSAHIYQQPG